MLKTRQISNKCTDKSGFFEKTGKSDNAVLAFPQLGFEFVTLFLS